MKVEMVTPGDHLGDVLGDNEPPPRHDPRPARPRCEHAGGGAHARLSAMFGYIGQLRSMTSGRASFTMEFSHYDPVPKNVADEVIAEVQKRKAAANA